MATKKAIVSKTVKTTKIAEDAPLSYVTCYGLKHGKQPRVEIDASVEHGNATHVFELSLTPDAATELAHNLMEAVKKTEAA